MWTLFGIEFTSLFHPRRDIIDVSNLYNNLLRIHLMNIFVFCVETIKLFKSLRAELWQTVMFIRQFNKIFI